MNMKRLILLALAGLSMSANSFGMSHLRKGFSSALAMAKQHPKKTATVVATAGVTGYVNWPEEEKPDNWQRYALHPSKDISLKGDITVKRIMATIKTYKRCSRMDIAKMVCQKTNDALHDFPGLGSNPLDWPIVVGYLGRFALRRSLQAAYAFARPEVPCGTTSWILASSRVAEELPATHQVLRLHKDSNTQSEIAVDINWGKCKRQNRPWSASNTETLSCFTPQYHAIYELSNVERMEPIPASKVIKMAPQASK